MTAQFSSRAHHDGVILVRQVVEPFPGPFALVKYLEDGFVILFIARYSHFAVWGPQVRISKQTSWAREF